MNECACCSNTRDALEVWIVACIWGGRLNDYCHDCATARCDAYLGDCRWARALYDAVFSTAADERIVGIPHQGTSPCASPPATSCQPSSRAESSSS